MLKPSKERREVLSDIISRVQDKSKQHTQKKQPAIQEVENENRRNSRQ